MQPDDFDTSYNPFDDEGRKCHKDEPIDRGKHYFGSAFPGNSSIPVTPAASRRRSSAEESQVASGSTIRRRHKRSQSDLRVDLQDPDEPSHGSGHPLKSAALKTAQFIDGITRPYLSRMVQSSSIDNNLFGAGTSGSTETLPRIKEPMTEVLVHDVSPSDSLAGVSLKYGIELIELRRANQLWANDSIHLRETLLIPLHRATRARRYIIQAAGEVSNESPAASGSTSDPGWPIPSSSLLGINVRRVPISQLSGFPPSSIPYRSPAPATSPSSSAIPSASTSPSKPGSIARNNTLTSNSLTTLLNALPIAASTRDEITSRLSLDSVSSSQSDRVHSRTSLEDSGHEMKHVGHSQLPPDMLSGNSETPRVSHRAMGNSSRNTTTRTSENNRAPRLSTSPPAAYVPHAHTHNPYVRTVQMEPSPGMKLPLLTSNSDGYQAKMNKMLDSKLNSFGTTRGQQDRPPVPPTDLGFGSEVS